MRILVTGREGQVARSLAERAGAFPALELVFASRPDLDLERPGSFDEVIRKVGPDLVLNAAAYTAVDNAEAHEPLAQRINAQAAGEGARAAAQLGIPFIQISTDYVFDGSGSQPWKEDDPVNPLNAYGRSKAEGERAVLAASPSHIIVRTSWLTGPFGSNFAKTMLRLANERDEVAVVADQHGCPTCTLDLADALLAIAELAVERRINGIYHVAGGGSASWADLADRIFMTSAAAGGPAASVRRIATVDYPTPARRPVNSVLDCSKADRDLSIRLPDWRSSVDALTRRLLKS